MKKLLSLALALVLVLSLSVTAFAESVGPTVTNGTQNVTGKYVAAAESDPVYKVDITWGSMAFTYTAASKGTWSTSNHTYEGAKDATWSWADGANEIKVTNHSNAGITVTPKWNADDAYTNIAMTFGNSPLKLLTADNGSEESPAIPTVGSITVTPSGDLPKDTNGKIGSITLSIAGTDNSSTPTDEKAVITGIEVKVGDTTYKSGDTVILTPSSGDVTIIVKGTNLQNRTNDNMVEYVYNSLIGVGPGFVWDVSDDGTSASRVFELDRFESQYTEFEIQYSNDYTNNDTATWTGSGVKIQYTVPADEIATITSVKLTVGDTTYEIGDTVTLTPTSGTVTVTLNGANFTKLNSSRNQVLLAADAARTDTLVAQIDSSSWTVDTTNNTATKTFESTEFSVIDSEDGFEILYSNDGATILNSGLMVKYSAT